MSTDALPPPESATPRKTDARAARPRTGRGQRPMIWLVGLVLAVFAIANEISPTYVAFDRGPLWRVFVAILAFLYLWWLSSLLFDLAFIWHRYIQGDAAHRFLRENVQRASFRPKDDPPNESSTSAPLDLPPLSPSGGSSVRAPLTR